MIPRLSSVVKSRLAAELLRIIPKMEEDLSVRREAVASALKRWEAKSKRRSGPLGPRSSSVHPPFVAIVTDSIHSRIINALTAQDRDVNVSPKVDENVSDELINPDTNRPMTWWDVAVAIEKYILFEFSPSGEIPYRDFLDDLVRDAELTGTAFPIATWDIRTEFNFTRSASSMSSATSSITFDNICLNNVGVEDILIPSGYTDPRITNFPIITHRYSLRPGEILAQAEIHGWDASAVRELLGSGFNISPSPLDLTLASLTGEPLSTFGEFSEVWLGESWMKFRLDGKNEYRIVVTHSMDRPDLILNIEGWPYDHNRTKFGRAFRYIKRRKRLLGMGIPERLSAIDDTIAAISNQIVEGGTIANIPVWSVDENISGIRSLDDIYPGKVIKRGDDPNAILPLKGVGTGPDLFEAYNIFRDIGERASHVTDYSLGRESASLGKEGTATGILALLKETGGHFDTIISSGRMSADDICWMILMLIAQFKPVNRMASVLGKKKAIAVLAALSLKPSELNKKLSISVAFSNSAASEEVARQEQNALFALMQNYYEKLFLMATTVVQAPFLLPLAAEVGNDIHRRMRGLLESYGDVNTSESLPNFTTFLPVFQQEAQKQEMLQLLGAQKDEEDKADESSREDKKVEAASAKRRSA